MNSSRIVHGAHPPDNNIVEIVDDRPVFLPFQMTFPQFKDGKVHAAWQQAGHDVQIVTSLLLDPFFSYQLLPFPAPKAPLLVMSLVTGSVATTSLRVFEKNVIINSIKYAKL